MFSMLNKLGIPPKFIPWIKLLYSEPGSCVIVNIVSLVAQSK